MINIVLHSWGVVIPVALLLGLGLAMDVFAVSISTGCKDKNIRTRKIIIMAVTFGFFQGIMPLIGWAIVYGLGSIKEFSYIFSQIVPPLAFIILGLIGSKMIYECFNKKDEETEDKKASKSFVLVLILEAIATSIDALSSGLAMTDYTFSEVGVSILLIALMSFVMGCLGIVLGRKFGNRFSNKAEMVGGIILIVVGAFILIKGEIRVNAPQIIPEWLSWLF